MRIVLAALLACLMLTTAAAQEEQGSAADEPAARLFDLGMTALELAEQADRNAERRELYDKATQAFRAILVNRPELIRVRLELARVFFLKGQDRAGAAPFRGGASRRRAAPRGRQHPALSRHHAVPQAHDRILRPGGRP